MKKSALTGLFRLTLIALLAFAVKAQSESASSKIKNCGDQTDSADLGQYAGRFGMSDGSVLIVAETGGELTLRPIF